ncbi:hypothetical protein [Streptomyces sp. NPDC059009]|uniref:hypothetical protein n=1 Tax=Streptomyces sp. NPDC059009 TaxID=3346694 RepID=UPI0036B41065
MSPTTRRRSPRPAALSPLLLLLLLLLLLAGCGVRPTGVIGAGKPPTGLTKGLRLYFVSGNGRLEGVSRPGVEIRSLDDALKFLAEGPTEAEQERGLTSMLSSLSFDVTADGTKLTARSPDASGTGGRREDLANGQLVCTLARAQSVLQPRIRPDEVQVTLVREGTPMGPYRCSQFLDN